MNQGICYLYEYENDCRKRNIGFLQITQHYHSCRVSLHLKALPVPPGTTLELHAFYLKDSTLIHAPAAILNYSGGNIATQLSISESLFPEGKTLDEIDGFLLLTQNSNHHFLWIASRNALPVSFVIASDTDNSPEENEDDISLQAASLQDSASESSPPQGTSEKPKSVVVDSDSSADLSPIADSDAPQTTADPTFDSAESQNTPSESNSTTPLRENAIAIDSVSDRKKHTADRPPTDLTSNVDSEKNVEATDSIASTNSADSSTQQQTNDTPSLFARKITRKELSILPRKFWGLANNSFLLHGYHNYDHLLLIEEDGHVWLGVPGIYDAREARAAELFGFPQFTHSYVSLLNLSDEERNDQEDFGHWCRYLNF